MTSCPNFYERMNSMRRCLSMILCLSMVLSLFAGTALQVSAENPEPAPIAEPIEITSVELQNVPAAVVGEAMVTDAITAPDGAHYSVKVVNWLKNNGSSYQSASGTLAQGEYILHIELAPEEGYAFADNVTVPTGMNKKINSSGIMVLSKIIDLRELEDSVNIIGIPAVEIGTVAGLTGLSVDPADHAYVDMSGTTWQHLDDYTWTTLPAGSSFEAGKTYRLRLMVRTPLEWKFTEEPTVTLDGKASGEFTYGKCDGDTYFYYCTESVTAVAGEIPKVSMTITAPVIGAAPADAAVPADAKYSLVSTVWYNLETNEPMNGNFADGGKYQAVITVKPADGWVIPGTAAVYVNNELVSDWSVNADGNLETIMKYHFCEELTNASVTFTAPEVGKTPPEVTVPADANYQIAEVGWIDYDRGSDMGEDDVFELGKNYLLRLKLKGKPGYIFTDDATVLINGEESWESYVQSDGSVSAYEPYSFTSTIEKVEVSFEAPAVGKEAPEVTIANQDQYDYVYTYWYDYHEDKDLEGPFQKGGAYDLSVELEPAPGYVFAEDVEIYINGELFTGSDCWVREDSLEFYHKFHFAEEIEKVELSFTPEAGKGLPTVKVSNPNQIADTYFEWEELPSYDDVTEFELGGAYNLYFELEAAKGYVFTKNTKIYVNGELVDAYRGMTYSEGDYGFNFYEKLSKVELTFAEPAVGSPVPEVTLANPEKYSVVKIEWRDATTGVAATEFGKGYYELCVYVEPADGIVFTDDVKVYMNGKECSDYYGDDYYQYAYYEADFRTDIKAVDLPAWPKLQVGDEVTSTIMNSEDGSYTRQVILLEIQENGSQIPSSKVEQGKTYAMMIMAKPAEGYRITAATKVTQDGKAATGRVNGDLEMYRYVVLMKYYDFDGVKIIDTVAVKSDPAPAIGKEGGVITSADTNYTVLRYLWGVAKTDGLTDAETLEGTFEEGDIPMLILSVEAKDGYVISMSPTVTVNGKKCEVIASVTVMDGTQTMIVVKLPKLTKTDPGKDPVSPSTGDSSHVIGFAALMLFSLCGAGYVLIAGKKRRIV